MPEASPAPLFFALAAPAEVRALAARLQDAARRTLGPARFPAPEGLHITLAFLGRTEAAQVPALLGLAARVAGPSAGFSLRAAGIGGFPRPGRTRILWMGFDPQPSLAALAERLREALRGARVPFDEKPFMPHLTLARFKEPVDLGRAAFPELEPVVFRVGAISLFQSLPAPQGTRYELLGRVPLEPA
jgi:2'-5' RNA ligase